MVSTEHSVLVHQCGWGDKEVFKKSLAVPRILHDKPQSSFLDYCEHFQGKRIEPLSASGTFKNPVRCLLDGEVPVVEVIVRQSQLVVLAEVDAREESHDEVILVYAVEDGVSS